MAPSSRSTRELAGRRIDRLRRRILRHRRGLAALAVAAAAYVGVQAATAPPPATVAVWVAAHHLDGGAAIGPGDLRRQQFRPDSVPADRIGRPADVLGRTLAAPVSSGTALTRSAVVGDHWLAGRPGLAAVPVRLTDPAVAALLHPGDRVELVEGGAGNGSTGADPDVSTPATVLAVPEISQTPENGDSLQGRLVVMGVPSEAADMFATASLSRVVSVIWDD